MNVANRPSRPSVAKQSKHKSRPAKPPRRPARPLRLAGGGATTGLAKQKMVNGTCTPQRLRWHLPNWISAARSGGVTISRTADRHSNSGHLKSSLKEKKKGLRQGHPRTILWTGWMKSNVVVVFSTCLTIGKLFHSFAREKGWEEKQLVEKTSLRDFSGQHKHRCMMMMMIIATTRGRATETPRDREREREKKRDKRGSGPMSEKITTFSM